jgi:hypothetical protein
MAVLDQDVVVYRGEAVTLNFTMDPVVDITGWTFLFSVAALSARERQFSATRLIAVPATKVISQAGAILVAAAGTFSVALTALQTDLATGLYEYDVWRTNAGSETLLAAGRFVVGGVVRLPTS